MDVNGIVIAAIAVLFVAIALALVLRGKGPDALPIVPRRLMTERERRVIEMIEAAAPACRVHAQVSMGALLEAKRGLDRSRQTAVRNRFNRKIVDYVIEDKKTGDVVAIVELDDRTHRAAKDKERDRLTSAAGYNTIRLPAGERITLQAVRERLAAAFPLTA